MIYRWLFSFGVDFLSLSPPSPLPGFKPGRSASCEASFRSLLWPRPPAPGGLAWGARVWKPWKWNLGWASPKHPENLSLPPLIEIPGSGPSAILKVTKKMGVKRGTQSFLPQRWKNPMKESFYHYFLYTYFAFDKRILSEERGGCETWCLLKC